MKTNKCHFIVKVLLIFLLILFSGSILFARNLSPVLNQIRENTSKFRFAPAYSVDRDVVYIPVAIKSNDSQNDYNFLKDIGCRPRTIIGQFITADITPQSLHLINDRSSIIYVSERAKKSPRNDKSREGSLVDIIHSGGSGLPKPYTGKDVIVGIIDTGLDLTHEDFKFSDETTRVLYVWDQTDESATGPGGIGRVWTKSEIDAGQSTQVDADGHGTHVAGTAVGNGNEDSLYKGMAPEADIIIVNTDWMHIVEGAQFIFDKAEEHNKPAVVSMSLGWHYGPHDGTDLEDLALNELAEDIPGRVMVAAAGNEGSWYKIHYQGTPTATANSFTCSLDEGVETTRIEIWYDTQNFSDYIEFKFEVWDSLEEEKLWESDFIRAGSDSFVYTYRDEAVFGNDDAFEINVVSEVDNPINGSSCIIISYSHIFDEFYLKIFYKGQNSHFDAWVAIDYTAEFAEGNNYYTVGSPAVAKDIIAVASYVTRKVWTDVDGDPQTQEGAVIGKISEWSSRGPSRRMDLTGPKPDFAAPGEVIVSSLSKDYDAIEDERISDKYVTMYGTSMATPAIAGIVALMLERNPEYTSTQIRQLLRETAVRDADVTSHGSTVDGVSNWNRYFGYGKVDALAAIKEVESDTSVIPPVVVPTPVITSPTTEITYDTNSTILTLSGTVIEDASVLLFLNNVFIAIEEDIAGTNWSFQIGTDTPQFKTNDFNIISIVADSDSVRSETASITILVDNKGPVPPVSLNLSVSDDYDITPIISWTSFSDSSSIDTYVFVISNNEDFTLSDTFYVNSNSIDFSEHSPLVAGSTYYVKIIGIDKFNQHGNESEIENFTIRIIPTQNISIENGTARVGNILDNDDDDTLYQIFQSDTDDSFIVEVEGSKGKFNFYLNFQDTGNYIRVNRVPENRRNPIDKSISYLQDISAGMFVEINSFNSADQKNDHTNISLEIDFTGKTFDNKDNLGIFRLNESDSIWYNVLSSWQPGGVRATSFEIYEDTLVANLKGFSTYYFGEGIVQNVNVTQTNVSSSNLYSNETKTVSSVRIRGDQFFGDTLKSFAIANAGNLDNSKVSEVKLYRSSTNQEIGILSFNNNKWENNSLSTTISSAGEQFYVTVKFNELVSSDVGKTFKAKIPSNAVSTLKTNNYSPSNDLVNSGVFTVHIQTPIVEKIVLSQEMLERMPSVTDPIKVHFNDPVNIRTFGDCDFSFDKILAGFLLTAETSVELILYDFGDATHVNFLTELAQTIWDTLPKRGIDVRAVLSYQAAERLERFAPADSITVYSGRHEMHHKVAIVDGKRITTGSTNWTFNGFFRNNNHILLIENENLAQNYSLLFDQLYAGYFDSDAVSVEHPIVYFEDGTEIRTSFSPNGRVIRNIRDTFRSAEDNIYFFCFTFNHWDIINELAARHHRGIGVKGITEVRQVQTNWRSFSALVDTGIPVIKAMSDGRMHHKAAVVDPGTKNATVIAGSANWTVPADEQNYENTLIIRSQSIAKKFLNEFNKIWATNSVIGTPVKNEISTFYNKPNPASEYTIFVYDLPPNTVGSEINIFTLAAERVRTITNPTLFPGGINEYIYDLTNDYGRNLASGLYFVEIKAFLNTGNPISKVEKMLIRRR